MARNTRKKKAQAGLDMTQPFEVFRLLGSVNSHVLKTMADHFQEFLSENPDMPEGEFEANVVRLSEEALDLTEDFVEGVTQIFLGNAPDTNYGDWNVERLGQAIKDELAVVIPTLDPEERGELNTSEDYVRLAIRLCLQGGLNILMPMIASQNEEEMEAAFKQHQEYIVKWTELFTQQRFPREMLVMQ
ncbi:MAG: hypothetical protein Q4E62_05725 [Sutterellaceae bacterium]|nr:hypothetical protein [Sutterellaceae bacterium]